MTSTEQRILVVDDDPGLVRMVRMALLTEGIEVVTAGDGVRGLQAVRAAGFDLIVLDLQMPVMDGRTFFKELRRQGYSIPVIITSAYGAEEARRELGAEYALGKPFDPFVLLRLAKKLVREGREPSAAVPEA